VVDPIRGVLFWSDAGTNMPRIERAGLDGSSRTPIVKERVGSIFDLALDYEVRSTSSVQSKKYSSGKIQGLVIDDHVDANRHGYISVVFRM